MSVTFLKDIRAEARVHGELKDRLIAAYGLDEDDQTLIDTLEGEADFVAIAAHVARRIQQIEDDAEALAGRIKTLQARKSRMDDTAEKLRVMLGEAMLDAHQTKLPLPDMTVSVRMGKSRLIIADPDAIPDRYKVAQPITFKPNKDAIQEAVDHGDVPEGVQISNPKPVLMLRAK